LEEACSDAAATTTVRCWVDSAVLRRLPAAVSSCAEAADTVCTTPPTVSSKLSASRHISALRADAAACAAASRSCASRSAFSTALSLNVSTAPAMSPISSLRPSPGSTTSKLPSASLRIAPVIADSGRDIARPIIQASSPTPSEMSTIAICIRSLVFCRESVSATSLSPRTFSTAACAAVIIGSIRA